MIRLYEFPFSTNVERVTLAAGIKGIELEHVRVDPAERTVVREVSGQELVPVIEDRGRAICDSMTILAHFEHVVPEPPLHLKRPGVAIFCDWFNRVWKVAPNKIAETGETEPWADDMRRHLDWLDGYFSAAELSAADLVAFPFLKYATGRDPADDEEFHVVLDDHQSVEGRPGLAAWIERIDALPRG